MEPTGTTVRVDERTIMFSRAGLKPGTEQFYKYYLEHPDQLERDDKFRSLPGLLQPGSLYYNPLVFKAADSTFDSVSALHDRIDGEVNPYPVVTDPAKLTQFIVNWCLSLGGHSAGITHLKATHLYSVGGRKHHYGQPVQNDHQYAIAFTLEMDYQIVKMAPQGPITLESSAQYLRAGSIAVTLAAFIRNLGYPARAHIDGNYQVRCPQVARDAGLGEIGRMSLLMTPDLGPRVRIAVVTTSIPLHCTPAKTDSSVPDFCRICNKCAVNCPANAISYYKIADQDGDWRINQEACYSYWCKSGTDCGRCLSVCPYSHRKNLFHDSIRFFVRKSCIFRRMAVSLDNFFYGRKPGMQKLDDWMGK